MAKSGPSSRTGKGGSAASEQTRHALVAATIETLKDEGFVGASARAIATRAGCNQALVFYHFGSVANLLLAALDEVSAQRMERYQQGVDGAATVSEMAAVATSIFEEDLAAGYATVLVELIGGARSIPGFGAEVASRIRPWSTFAQDAIERAVDPTLLAVVAPPSEIAYGLVAMYLGLEMLTHLDGDPANAIALFDRARSLVTLLEAFLPTAPTPNPEARS